MTVVADVRFITADLSVEIHKELQPAQVEIVCNAQLLV